VDGICVIGNLNTPTRQLITESYRARSACQRWLGQACGTISEVPRRGNEGLPEALVTSRVECSEDLPASGIEYGETAATGFSLHLRACEGRSAQPPPNRVQRADSAHRQASASRQSICGRQADANADERARPEANRDPPNCVPASSAPDRSLDLSQQRR